MNLVVGLRNSFRKIPVVAHLPANLRDILARGYGILLISSRFASPSTEGEERLHRHGLSLRQPFTDRLHDGLDAATAIPGPVQITPC